MAEPVSNVNITTQTFPDWLDKTNLLCFLVSTDVLTANTTLGTTTGNAYVNGFFSANSLIAVTSLRGGNNTTANTLYITTNVIHSNTTLHVSGNVAFVNTNPNQVVDSFALSAFRTTKYLLQVNTAIGYQSTEILVLPDGGANVQSTEYATLSTNGALGVFTLNVASGNVNLLITPAVNATSVNFHKTSLRA